jgi:hypothetical protein
MFHWQTVSKDSKSPTNLKTDGTQLCCIMDKTELDKAFEQLNRIKEPNRNRRPKRTVQRSAASSDLIQVSEEDTHSSSSSTAKHETEMNEKNFKAWLQNKIKPVVSDAGGPSSSADGPSSGAGGPS